MGEHPEELSSAYKKCLDLMKDNQLRSIVSDVLLNYFHYGFRRSKALY